MPHRQVIRDIQAGSLKSVYLLHGEEPYFIDEIAKALENNVVEESMRDFNNTLLVAYLGCITKGTGMVNDVVDKYNLAYEKHTRRRGIF